MKRQSIALAAILAAAGAGILGCKEREADRGAAPAAGRTESGTYGTSGDMSQQQRSGRSTGTSVSGGSTTQPTTRPSGAGSY